MGCGSSSSVGIEVLPKNLNEGHTENPVQKSGRATKFGSTRSIQSCESDPESRQNSATSTNSRVSEVTKCSIDSGVGADESAETDDSSVQPHSQSIITEHSEERLVRQVENGFRSPSHADLWVSGRAFLRKQSPSDRSRLEQQLVLQQLRDEGLVSKPKSKSSGGVSFEVVMATADPLALCQPPARLARLRERKEEVPLTKEDIKRKLERAETRRKEKEMQKVERLGSLYQRPEVKYTLDSFAQTLKRLSGEQSDECEPKNGLDGSSAYSSAPPRVVTGGTGGKLPPVCGDFRLRDARSRLNAQEAYRRRVKEQFRRVGGIPEVEEPADSQDDRDDF